MILELPWPPSVNHYYRHVGPRVLISRDGRTYRETVARRLQSSQVRKFTGEVELQIQLYPPDRRRRDIDNCLKCLLDSLTIGGLYEDDSQIKKLGAEMLEPIENGMVMVKVSDHKMSRRGRLKKARMIFELLPAESIERKVALCFMANFSELDIRAILDITKKTLDETKLKLRKIFAEEGF